MGPGAVALSAQARLEQEHAMAATALQDDAQHSHPRCRALRRNAACMLAY